jgi:hypothetical protein
LRGTQLYVSKPRSFTVMLLLHVRKTKRLVTY